MKTRVLSMLVFLSMLTVIARGASMDTLQKCEVLEIDRTNLSFSVRLLKTNETRFIQITSQTRFFRGGKPAVSEDMAVGDTVFGQVHRRNDGAYEAVRIFIEKPKQAAVRVCARRFAPPC